LIAFATGPAAAVSDGPATEQTEKKVEAPAKPDEKNKKKKKKTKKRKRRRCRSYAKPAYKKMVRNWQKVPKIPKPRHRAGYRDLTIYSVNLGERVRVFPFLPDGTLDPEALTAIERVFRDKDTQTIHEIHPRLVKLLYRLADHFDAKQVNVISGYREPKQPEGEGHHAHGSAADIMLPGVKLPALAKIARRMGHVGVGYYPASGFIHLDVREGRSYFWADRSGPGLPGCPRQIMKSHAFRYDRRWDPEDDEPELHRNRKGELLGAIEVPVAEPEGPSDSAPSTPSAVAPDTGPLP
jgi:uncharacterized protein YcbK (DUF882 family)